MAPVDATFAEAEPEIDIEGVDNSTLAPIPADVMVNFDENEAKFEKFLED